MGMSENDMLGGNGEITPDDNAATPETADIPDAGEASYEGFEPMSDAPESTDEFVPESEPAPELEARAEGAFVPNEFGARQDEPGQESGAPDEDSAPASYDEPEPEPVSAPTPPPIPAPPVSAPVPGASAAATSAPAASGAGAYVDVHPIQYTSFDDDADADGNANSMELVYDIPLQVTVELGKTYKEISEILEFGMGTIIVLDKLAGDPVEVFANGKLIARGEVVVIDENYGVRVTEIVNGK
jgi:flagellar motor switch protein FliN/FliY